MWVNFKQKQNSLHLSINHDTDSAAKSICLFHIVGCQDRSAISILETGFNAVPAKSNMGAAIYPANGGRFHTVDTN